MVFYEFNFIVVGKKIQVYVLLFDMNVVYEVYVVQFLCCFYLMWMVVIQVIQWVLGDVDGFFVFWLCFDLLLCIEEGQVIVVDIKWKCFEVDKVFIYDVVNVDVY